MNPLFRNPGSTLGIAWSWSTLFAKIISRQHLYAMSYMSMALYGSKGSKTGTFLFVRVRVALCYKAVFCQLLIENWKHLTHKESTTTYFYATARSPVNVGVGYSQVFEEARVHQGTVPSPLLFITILEALSREFHSGIFPGRPSMQMILSSLLIDSLEESFCLHIPCSQQFFSHVGMSLRLIKQRMLEECQDTLDRERSHGREAVVS